MRRPSPALVVATVALVFSVTGTGWAVTQLPRNSVGTAQLKKNAVTGAKVKKGSLDASDFKAGALPAGAKGDTGARGPSDAYASIVGGVVPGPTDAVVLESPTLPAGSYVTFARINVLGDANNASNAVTCTMTPDVGRTGIIQALDGATLTLVGAQTLSQPGTVKVFCRRDNLGGLAEPLLEVVRVTAIRVETLTQTGQEGGAG